jgi:hypothetical protein
VRVLLVCVSCGGSTSNAKPGASGVNGSKPVNILTDQEKATFCDWENSLEGGYGRTVTCDAGGQIHTLKAAGIAVGPSGRWGHRTAKPAIEVITGSEAAISVADGPKPAIEAITGSKLTSESQPTLGGAHRRAHASRTAS